MTAEGNEEVSQLDEKLNYFFWRLTIVEEGLKFAFDVRTTLNVSHVIFHPSTTSHSYDLYATSADKGDVLFLNLEAGETHFYLRVHWVE